MAKKSVSRKAEPAKGGKISVHPLDDRVLIEPSEAEEKTSGGIVLPDTAKEKPQRGTVVAVGPGRLLDNGNRVAVAVAVGDEVVYGKYSGNEIKVGTRKLVICREGDILGVLEK